MHCAGDLAKIIRHHRVTIGACWHSVWVRMTPASKRGVWSKRLVFFCDCFYFLLFLADFLGLFSWISVSISRIESRGQDEMYGTTLDRIKLARRALASTSKAEIVQKVSRISGPDLGS